MQNNDLISRNALIKKAAMRGHCLRPMVTAFHMCVDVNDIKKAPTVDAVMLPPVKVGDTAHFVINGQIYEATICILQWYKHPSGVIDEIRGNVVGGSVSASFSDFGKTVFLTREEAEAALAERTGRNEDRT